MDRIKFFCVTNKEVNFLEKENHNLCWVGSEDPPKNYIKNNTKQKPILTLRGGLDGILNYKQITLVKMLNFKHVTYEHAHPNKYSIGMLKREQTWLGLIQIILKNLIKFYLRSIKHNYLYKKNYG